MGLWVARRRTSLHTLSRFKSVKSICQLVGIYTDACDHVRRYITLLTLVINTGCTVNKTPVSKGVRGHIFRPGAGLD